MSSNGHPVIRLEGVTKVFFTDEVETHALSGIHLRIRRGEFISIAGPSGCGKSTLLSILGLLDSPTGGAYWLNDKPAEMLKASCPSETPATPPARLAAVAGRLDSLLAAVQQVHAALNDFYGSLSDEQKAQFNGIAPVVQSGAAHG